MNTIKNQTKKGFTIIEVVLVLAIAGLIFLMVFLALPALQRSQRDTQRKNDLSRLQAAINDYKSANRGRLPDGNYQTNDNNTVTSGNTRMRTVVDDFVKVNGSTFLDPGTNKDYQITTQANPTAPVNGINANTESGTIFFYARATCADGGQADRGNSPVLRIKLEGQANAYCIQA